MPVAYTIDPTLRLVRFDVGERLPTLANLQRLLDQLAGDPLFKRGFGALVNLRDYPVEPAFVRSALIVLAARLTLFGASRWAYVTSNPDAYYARLLQQKFATDHGIQYGVFMDESEAVSWLLEASAER
jgi:hypothetical protein